MRSKNNRETRGWQTGSFSLCRRSMTHEIFFRIPVSSSESGPMPMIHGCRSGSSLEVGLDVCLVKKQMDPDCDQKQESGPLMDDHEKVSEGDEDTSSPAIPSGKNEPVHQSCGQQNPKQHKGHYIHRPAFRVFPVHHFVFPLYA